MPWCQGCSFEYPVGKKKCPECAASLRNNAAGLDGIKYKNKNWTSIRMVPDPIQAEFMRNFLKSNGFDVAIKNGDAEINHKVSLTSDKVHILVPTESARTAALLLRTDMTPIDDDLEEDPIDVDDLAEDEELLPEDEETAFAEGSGLVVSFEDEEEYL